MSLTTTNRVLNSNKQQLVLDLIAQKEDPSRQLHV